MPNHKEKIKIQFFETCYATTQNAWVDEREGLRQISKVTKGNSTEFPSLEKASVAAEEYSLEHGYPCEAFLCEHCKHFHVRQNQTPRDIPEEDLWLPSRHRARRTRVREMEAARRAEEERVRMVQEELEARRSLRSAAKVTERLARCVAVVVKVKRASALSRDEAAAARAKSDRELRVQRNAAELCNGCGGPRTTPGRKLCEECRVRNKENADRNRQNSKKERRKERRAAGLCPQCGEPPIQGNMCEAHRVRFRDYGREARQRKKGNAVIRTAEEQHAFLSNAVKQGWVGRKANAAANLPSSPASGALEHVLAA
jgi:hypothetical protein